MCACCHRTAVVFVAGPGKGCEALPTAHLHPVLHACPHSSCGVSAGASPGPLHAGR